MAKTFFFLLGIIVFGGALWLLLQTNASNSYTLYPQKKIQPALENFLVYTNKTYEFSVMYPSSWTYREYEAGSGVGFRPKSKPNDPSYEYIGISILPKPINVQKSPFEQYVKTAAINEIQNYQSLASIATISAKNGIIGYKTIWNVLPLNGNILQESLPITYFQPKDTTKTILIFLNDKNYMQEYNSLISSFQMQ